MKSPANECNFVLFARLQLAHALAIIVQSRPTCFVGDKFVTTFRHTVLGSSQVSIDSALLRFVRSTILRQSYVSIVQLIMTHVIGNPNCCEAKYGSVPDPV